MDTASPRGRSWLAGMLILLLVLTGGALLKTFWATINPEPSNPSTPQSDNDHLPEFDLDEALVILADSRSTSFEVIAATNSVERAGVQAIPGLIKLLDKDTDYREQVIRLLGKLGPAAQAAAAPLRAACEDPSPHVRQAALEAAWNVHEDREVLREILLHALKDGPEQVSVVAIDYLSELNPPAVEDLLPYVEQGQYGGLGGRATQRLLGVAAHDRELLRRLLKMGVRGGPRSELEALVRTEKDDEIHLTALLSLVRMSRDDLPRDSIEAPDGSPNDSAQDYFAELVERCRVIARPHARRDWHFGSAGRGRKVFPRFASCSNPNSMPYAVPRQIPLHTTIQALWTCFPPFANC